jgi:lipoate-protein ligase A
LCNFDLSLIAQCLGKPIREPDYREGRSHLDFLTQLPTTSQKLSEAIVSQWGPELQTDIWPQELTNQLMQKKYQQDQWNFKI